MPHKSILLVQTLISQHEMLILNKKNIKINKSYAQNMNI